MKVGIDRVFSWPSNSGFVLKISNKKYKKNKAILDKFGFIVLKWHYPVSIWMSLFSNLKPLAESSETLRSGCSDSGQI